MNQTSAVELVTYAQVGSTFDLPLRIDFQNTAVVRADPSIAVCVHEWRSPAERFSDTNWIDDTVFGRTNDVKQSIAGMYPHVTVDANGRSARDRRAKGILPLWFHLTYRKHQQTVVDAGKYASL